jgi:RecA/RadA recombinase
MVGDSSSGKTFLALTCLAEATINSQFDDYRLIYDNTEGGALMDIKRFFGHRVYERLEAPSKGEDGSPSCSRTVQEFYYHVDDAIKAGIPFIYVLDSQDCLSSDEELEKFQDQKRAFRKGKEATGSYGDSKAKVHSANLRKLMAPLAEMNSLVIITNQTRDSFDMFESTTYSGGRALTFYVALQLWSSVAGRLKRTVRGRERELGVVSKVRIKKNRVAGRDRTVLIPIYHSHGIDNVGGCVDYLIAEGIWKKVKGADKVLVSGLGPEWEANYEGVIRKIEEDGMEQDLVELVEDTWNEIEDACKVSRRFRYE